MDNTAGWISVGERFPEGNVWVFAVVSGEVILAEFGRRGFYTDFGLLNGVTHWMPVNPPSPPPSSPASPSPPSPSRQGGKSER